MKEPNVSDIKVTMGIPKETPFIGWLIQNPRKDDFLLKYSGSEVMVNSLWTQTPEHAFRFKRFKKAHKVLNSLEFNDRAIVVAAFDSGGQVLIASQGHEDALMVSDNPFRKFAEKEM